MTSANVAGTTHLATHPAGTDDDSLSSHQVESKNEMRKKADSLKAEVVAGLRARADAARKVIEDTA